MLYGLPTYGQTKISGTIVDNKLRTPLENTQVENVHSKEKVISDSNGNFQLIVKSGELISALKKGYDKVYIRISNEKQPTYYKLHLDKTIPRLDVRGHLLPYQRDSLEYHEAYSGILSGAKKGDNFARESGNVSLDALSKQNRDRWAFQAMFEKWQNEKYVNYVFNDSLVKRITYLEGSDLRRFMARFKPSYTFLRSATEYQFLRYIKRSYIQFQKEEGY